MNATEQFNERITTTFEKLEVIKMKLEELKNEQKLQPNNWGFSGSVGHINEELDNIIEFLGSK